MKLWGLSAVDNIVSRCAGLFASKQGNVKGFSVVRIRFRRLLSSVNSVRQCCFPGSYLGYVVLLMGCSLLVRQDKHLEMLNSEDQRLVFSHLPNRHLDKGVVFWRFLFTY